MHEYLPYPNCTHAMLCTMPFCRHSYCPSLHSDLSRCTAETIVLLANAACRRPLSFLRMMHHCIITSGFGPKVLPADRSQGWRLWDRQRNSFPISRLKCHGLFVAPLAESSKASLCHDSERHPLQQKLSSRLLQALNRSDLKISTFI